VNTEKKTGKTQKKKLNPGNPNKNSFLFDLGHILAGSFYRGKLNSDFYSPQKLDFFLILFQAEKSYSFPYFILAFEKIATTWCFY
jgi:hypothetical protein